MIPRLANARSGEADFGALPVTDGVRFRLWAPAARELTLVVHTGRAAGRRRMPRDEEGVFDLIVDKAAAGDRYSYQIDDRNPRPDPASRFQPEGVHGPSEVVDASTYRWSDAGWRGRSLRDLIVYELHVGTFTREGTFAGVRSKLQALRDLGVTAIELMPLADFAGTRNWGYDGVALYAPARAYGRPDDLRSLVDEAHRFGLSVILDVVYNHLGPEGAYVPEFNPQHLTDRHETPWGGAVNLDGDGAAMVRRFIIDNALYWLREFHIDGLRLDATHALIDDSTINVVRELVATVRAELPRRIVIHAEDDRNLAPMVQDAGMQQGWGLDGVWADDFHHVVRRMLAGDATSYYADFTGTAGELARTIEQGWLFSGQRSKYMGRDRGTDASTVPMHRFVVCLQNHDQVGNRAMGDRLHHAIAAESWRAASALLLMVPMTPLLFMGQEWAASTPFLYFTDLEPELGGLVTEGRRREFADFPEFSAPEARERIPDPQARETFEASRLRWDEREAPGHAHSLALYRALIALRLDEPALGASDELTGRAAAPDDDTVIVRRGERTEACWIVVKLRGSGAVELARAAGEPFADGTRWDVLLTTEEPLFAADPVPIDVDDQPDGPVIRFRRPGAVVLKPR